MADPARILKLLWRAGEEPTRGPKPALTVDRVVAVAIELADTEGLDALSMRRVAERLGVGTMSLYTYVPGKTELIDLMLDAAYGEAIPPEPVAGDWRAALARVARDNWVLYHRHPWMLRVPPGRVVLGPNETRKYDHELRAIDGIGLTDVEMDAVLNVVLSHVQGTARASVEKSRAVARTGMTDAQWWEVHGPLLASLVDEEKYPLAVRVGAAAGAAHNAASDPEHMFEFGLARILDGVAALVRGRE